MSIAYLLDASFVYDHAFKLGIFAILLLDTTDIYQESPLVLSLVLLTNAVSHPGTPAGEGIVNYFLALFFNGLPFFCFELTHDVSSCKCSLDQVLIPYSKWKTDSIVFFTTISIRIVDV